MQNKKKIHFNYKKLILPGIVGLLMASSFFGGLLLGGKGIIKEIGPLRIFQGQTVVNKDLGKPQEVDFSLFWEAWDTLGREYYQDTDYQKMLYGAIKGMAEATGDPYTVYMTPEETEEFNKEIEGSFSGVGIEIAKRNDLLVVISALPETPAAAAGLRSRDVILKIDNQDANITVDEAVSKIRGAEGTEVTLTIQRGNEIKDVKITRKKISVKSVTVDYKKQAGKEVAVIKINQFNQDTVKDFQKIVDEILLKSVSGIVLDLRGNPGGYLNSSVSVASEFLDGGTVLFEEEKGGKKREIKTNEKARLSDIKLNVLIDEGSASASEILAGALQDRGRAKVIGQKSFGKGLVQMVFDLKKGSFKITIAKWLTPNGKSINEQGITPDIDVKLSDEDLNNYKDPQLDKALEEVIK
ncbi:S41 family peptidase [bacterium]|nr:S41 family peptidase [bacterium]